MAQYDLIDTMTSTFRRLEHALQDFVAQLNTAPLLAARVFTLPATRKGEEQKVIDTISVNQQIGKQAQQAAMTHFTHLFIQQQSENISTKTARRLPGALCYNVTDKQHQEICANVAEVNQLKAALEKIITQDSGLPSAQRFDWVHRAIPGLLTLNAYRTISLIPTPETLRFGWANKHIIKNLSRQDVLDMLAKSQAANRAVPPWTQTQWQHRLAQEIADITRLPSDCRLKIKRPVKVQPIARAWYPANQKQVQYACPSPLIVLCRRDKGEGVPLLGELLNYDAENIQHRHKPQGINLRLIIERLHLYYEQ